METLHIAGLLISVSLLVLGVKHVRDPERLVIFRLGKATRIAGPGFVFLIPAVDRAWRVNLDRAVPEWRSLGESDLMSKLLKYGSQPAVPTA